MRRLWWIWAVLWPLAANGAGFERQALLTGRGAACSPDGRLLVVLLSDDDQYATPQVAIRRLPDLQLLLKRRGTTCAFSPDSRWLAIQGETRRRAVVNGQTVIDGEPFLDVLSTEPLQVVCRTWADQLWFQRDPARLLLHRRLGHWESTWTVLTLPAGQEESEGQPPADRNPRWLLGAGHECWRAPQPLQKDGEPAPKPVKVSNDRRYLVVETQVDSAARYAVQRVADQATLVPALREEPVLAPSGGYAAVTLGPTTHIWDLDHARELGVVAGTAPVFVGGTLWTCLRERAISRRWRLPSLAVLDDCPGHVKWATPARAVAWRTDDQSLALWTVGSARRLARWTDQSDDSGVEFIAGGHALLHGEDVYDSGNGRRLGEIAGDRDTGGVSATWAWVATREPRGVCLWHQPTGPQAGKRARGN